MRIVNAILEKKKGRCIDLPLESIQRTKEFKPRSS